MMHIDNIVAVLVDANNKPFRELNSHRLDRDRKCDVFAPVDTEYKFLIKNNTDTRIRIEIDIDGSTVSGNGLILGAKSSDYIERFVDSDKKFKTSLVTGENVADPSSLENGIIKVRVTREKQETFVRHIYDYGYHHDYRRNNPWWTYPTVMYGTQQIGTTLNDSNQQMNYSANVSTSCLRGVKNNVPQEKLATVEGSLSNQLFGTTSWNGDDIIHGTDTFTFYLKLSSPAVDPEYIEYVRLKQKFG